MNLPEISIVVPVYKVEKYLKQCVDSILSQTFQNIEIILIDDGSPDSCGEICDNYGSKDARIKVIHQKNKGLSCARNIGVQASTGRYICFVDSDDSIDPEYCESLFNLLDGTNYDFSACSVLRYEDGTKINRGDDVGIIEVLSNEAFLEAQFLHKSEFGVWNKLYRRELFDQIHFMPNKIHEDVIWSADLARNLQNGIVMTSRQLYYYRQRNSGIVAEGSKKCHLDRVFAGEYLLETVEDKYPGLLQYALKYAIDYPWMFVDRVYVHKTFQENGSFLCEIQRFLKLRWKQIKECGCFDSITLCRMRVFSVSQILYGFNAYMRLARVVFYNKVLKKDAYVSGHGI